MPITIHVRLYNPNMQRLAVQVAHYAATFGYEVGPIEHATDPRDFATPEIEPAPGAAADEAANLLDQLAKAGVAPVKLLPPNPDCPPDSIRINLSNM